MAAVDINQLSVSQLGTVKKQLDEELEHLTTSIGKLRSAQRKFKECIESLELAGQPDHATTREATLVPLTMSLYVKGHIANPEQVMVDVGTGYLVDKKPSEAKGFYSTKATELDRKIEEIEMIAQGRSNSLRVVEESIRRKVSEQSALST